MLQVGLDLSEVWRKFYEAKPGEYQIMDSQKLSHHCGVALAMTKATPSRRNGSELKTVSKASVRKPSGALQTDLETHLELSISVALSEKSRGVDRVLSILHFLSLPTTHLSKIFCYLESTRVLNYRKSGF